MHRDVYEKEISKFQSRIKIFWVALMVLLLSNIWLGVLAYKTDEKIEVTENIKHYQYLDPSANLLQQEDVIVNLQPLRDQLNKMVQARSDENISIYFEYLPTGANINVNQNLKIWPVSLAKLPMAIMVMKKIEQGTWTMQTKLKVLPEDVNQNSGELYKNGPGAEYSIEYLLEVLITNSDNTAYRLFKRLVSDEDRRGIIDNIGLAELFEENGKVSAKEYSRLLRTLYVAGYLDQEHSNRLLELLANNKFKDFINKGLEGNVFAHKQGENIQYNVYADSGIVYLNNRPFILSVMVQNNKAPFTEAKGLSADFMAEVGREAMDYVKNF